MLSVNSSPLAGRVSRLALHPSPLAPPPPHFQVFPDLDRFSPAGGVVDLDRNWSLFLDSSGCVGCLPGGRAAFTRRGVCLPACQRVCLELWVSGTQGADQVCSGALVVPLCESVRPSHPYIPMALDTPGGRGERLRSLIARDGSLSLSLSLSPTSVPPPPRMPFCRGRPWHLSLHSVRRNCARRRPCQ
jgi:hypothetical protein